MPDPITGPLRGVRVIEMGSLIAGPYAGALLAQFGAVGFCFAPPCQKGAKQKIRGTIKTIAE